MLHVSISLRCIYSTEIVSFHINGAFVSAVRLRLFEKYINQVKVSCLKKQEVKDAKENMMGY